MTSTELVTMTQKELVAWLDADDLEETEDDYAFDYENAMRIMTAASPDEVLKVDDVRKVATLIDDVFTVRSIVWRKSTKRKDGKGRYAVMSCVDKDGVPFVASCGATKVVLQLRKYEVAGWLPAAFTLSAAETNSGNTVYELVAPKGNF